MTRMTASEAFVETLVAQGVTDVFGIVGSAYMDALDIFPAAGIRFIPTVHEQGSAHMADGYSRVSGRHGVCIGQNGPGITNFVTAIAAAYWAHSPVVAITPETGSNSIGLGGFQETDQLPIFSKITKYQGHVTGPKRMAELTARCFDMAMAERGPTQLNIPRDHFYGEVDVEIAQPKVIERGAGGENSLDEAAALLAGSQVPGHRLRRRCRLGRWGRRVCGSRRTPETRRSSPAICTTTPSRPSTRCGAARSAIRAPRPAMKLIAQADVVLALGTRLGPFGTLPQHGMDYWPKNAKDHPGRRRSPYAGPGQADLRRRLRRCQGRGQGGCSICSATGSWPAATMPTSACRRNQVPEGRLGGRARRLVPRGRRLEPRGRQGERLHAPAPDAARAGEGHAGERHGLHRHRQHLLGLQQLSAASRSRTASSPP